MYKPRDLIDYRICAQFVERAATALNANSIQMKEVLQQHFHYERLRTGPGSILFGYNSSFTDIHSCPDQQVYAVLRDKIEATERAMAGFSGKYAFVNASSPLDDLVMAVEIARADNDKPGLEELMEITAPRFGTKSEARQRELARKYGTELVGMMKKYLKEKAATLQPSLL